MTQAMPELLSQLSQHGISVAAAGPNIEVTMKGKPDPRVRLLLDQLKARKAEALRLLSGQPEPKPFEMPASPEATRARIAELEADLSTNWTGSTEDAIKVFELNALHWLDLRPGATECDADGKSWMAWYLEAQQ